MSHVSLHDIKQEPEFAISHQGNGKNMEHESEEYLHYNVSNFYDFYEQQQQQQFFFSSLDFR